MSSSNPPQHLLPSDEKFNGSNWVEWKSTIWAAAKQRGLLGYLTGDIARPSPGPAPAEAVAALSAYWGSSSPTLDQWMQRDAFTQGLIVLNVKNPVGHGVHTEGTAAESWASLTLIRDAVSDLGQLHAENHLRAIRYMDGGDLDAHFAALRVAWTEANAQGADIKDLGFRMIVLGSMPPTWNIVITTLRTVKTSSEVIVQLTLHGMLVASNSPISSTSAPTTQALATNDTRSGGRPRDVCTNPVCKRPGHTIERCFKPGGGMEGQFPPWWNKRGGTGGSATTTTTPAANAVIAPGVTSAAQYYAFSAQVSGIATSRLITYADSAASDHFFVERSDFVTYNPYIERQGSTAAPYKFPILGTGNVRKSTIYKGKRVELMFENALHTPTLVHNLVSIGRLDVSGKSVLFGNGVGTFLGSDGTPFMSGPRVGTMYELTLNAPGGDPTNALAARSQNKPTDLETWHRRLGHIGEDAIKSLNSQSLVEGLIITTKELTGKCEDCIFGKQTRRPFDEQVTPETEVLERVHLDLFGPTRVQSTGGKRYMLLAMDGGSSHGDGYFLAEKTADNCVKVLAHFHVTAERQTGKLLKIIRTDEGGEWVNDLVKAYCHKFGIVHETTAAYSSSANGVPERGNRTVLDRVRTLLHDAQLPGTYWAEAAATVMYLRDFIPSARHPGVTPFELWYGKKPDISHLRAFGCTAYARIPEDIVLGPGGNGKLADRSIKAVLIGYFGRGSYRLLDRTNGRIFRSRDVVFEEGRAHRTLEHSDAPSTGEIEDHVVLDDPPAPEAAPETIQDDERIQGIAPAHDAPSIPIAPTPVTEIPDAIPTTRRSNRKTKPTTALKDSLASEESIETARRLNVDWATDSRQPRMAAVIAAMTEFDDARALLTNPDDNWIPNSYTEAMTRPDLWKEPMDEEIAKLKSFGVWTLVDRPANTKLMKNRWTYANKYDEDGNLVGRRARLVAKGFTQIPGVDYFETYASVVRYESLRMNLAIAAAKGMDAWQIDYVSAYLNSPTQVPIHMEQPEGYVIAPTSPNSPEQVALVQKALYGTMDGANNWWKTLDEDMRGLGYYRSLADSSVRSRHVDGEVTITSTYTDDVTGISTTPEGGKIAREELGHTFKTKDLGDVKYILGIRVDRNREAGTISLSQRAYFERVLARYGMSDCKPAPTPLPFGVVLDKSQSPSTPEDHHYMKDKPYREVLGSVMYGEIATRFELAFATSKLSKYAINPGKAHWLALMHVLRYIKGTLDHKITYGGKGFTSLAPVGYVDSDFAADTDTRRSCGGYIFLQAGGPTAWGCQFQPTVALSTTEAEYMALSRAARQAIWMYSAMSEVGYPQTKPARLIGDNSGSISLTKNAKHNARAKHIDIRHHFIRERVEMGDIAVEYVPSSENLADILTKPLGRLDHHRLCVLLRLCDE